MSDVSSLTSVLGAFLVLWYLFAAVGLAISIVGYLISGSLGFLGYGFWGAGHLLEFASRQGFLGIAAYAACWFFMFPVMLIASFAAGALTSHAEKERAALDAASREALSNPDLTTPKRR